MDSIAHGTQLALRIRDGSYKPDGKPKHKQTPTVLGDFRFPVAVAAAAARYGKRQAAQIALELSGVKNLTFNEAIGFVNYATKF